MATSGRTAVEIGKELRINERFGRLLLKERQAVGRSLRFIARKFKINRYHLRRWEMGRSSPQANVFCAIMRFYGSTACLRAARLSAELQLKRYFLLQYRHQPVIPKAA